VASALTGVAARIADLPFAITEAAVVRFDEVAKASASRVVGGGATMRLHGRRGRRVPVKLGTRWNRSGDSVFINGTPAGPWVWIESGTEPHEQGRPFRRRVTFLKGPSYDHPIAGPIMHLGSTGRRAWTIAVSEFQSEFRDLAVAQVKEATRGR
jgi:hypothetical protein